MGLALGIGLVSALLDTGLDMLRGDGVNIAVSVGDDGVLMMCSSQGST